MNLSIIIPVGRPQTAQQTIQSVLDQSRLPDDVQIILAGCNLEDLVAHFADTRIIPVQLKERCNPAETRIAGIKAADREWYLFVDDDIELDSLFLEKLICAQEKAENIGAIGCRLPGREKTYFSRVTDLANFWSQQSSKSGERNWLYSAALAMPSAVYHAVGGFNPELAIGEDVDLTRKVREAGFRVEYDADLIAWHNHRRNHLFTAVSYFWNNGGLATYQFRQNGQLRVWNVGRVVTTLAASLKNTLKLNRGEVAGFSLFLPGIALMYLIYSFSLEYHYQRYTSRFLRENLSSDVFPDFSVPNIFLRKSLNAKMDGQGILAGIYSLAALLWENRTFVLLFFILLIILVML